MKKILWLPSWYPNKTNPFEGDFIQRMALATSLYENVWVIYVVKDDQKRFPTSVHVEMHHQDHLTEQIIYYRAGGLFPWIRKILALQLYFRLYRKYIRKWLREQGMPDFVHVQVPLKAGLLALWLKRKFQIPFVLTEHYGIYNRIVQDPFEERHFFYRHYTGKIIDQAAVFQTVSKSIGEHIRQTGIKKKFTVIYNAVDSSLFFPSIPAADKFRWIHVSNMIPLKNVEAIIRVFQKVYSQRSQTELLIVGPYPETIHELANQSGLLGNSIFFTGEVSYRQVAEKMQQSHALILFSRTENMPCVVLEALCCGLPVLASRVGGIPEVIDAQNGILIEPDDEMALFNAMITIMNNYPHFNRDEMARQAGAKFSYEVIGQQLSQAYKE